DGRESHFAETIGPAGNVVVVGYEGQAVDVRAGINREKRVKAAAQRVEGHRPIRGRGPAKPQRPAAGISRVVRFAGFLRGEGTVVGVAAVRAGQRDTTGKRIAETRVFGEQFLLMLRKVRIVGGRTDVIGGGLSVAK